MYIKESSTYLSMRTLLLTLALLSVPVASQAQLAAVQLATIKAPTGVYPGQVVHYKSSKLVYFSIPTRDCLEPFTVKLGLSREGYISTISCRGKATFTDKGTWVTEGSTLVLDKGKKGEFRIELKD